MPNAFHFALRSISAWRCAQTYEECSNLIVFSRLDFSLQFFGQAEESHLIVGTMGFILFCD